jgi:hypothetical protein
MCGIPCNTVMVCPYCNALQAEKEALQAELQALKLKQYWTFNAIYHLELEMKGANDEKLRCRCGDCRRGVGDHEECLFRPWFLSQLDALGLSYQIMLPATPASSDVHFHIPARALYGGMHVCDVDERKHDERKHDERKHDERKREQHYQRIQYGPKLLNATYGSEDLKKLDLLFERLLP